MLKRLLGTSFRLRLTVLMMLVVLLPLVAAIIFFGAQATQQLEQSAERNLALVGADLANSVSGWEDMTVRALLNMRAQPDIISMQAEAQKPVLTEMTNIYASLYLASTTDMNGLNVARSDDAAPKEYSDRPWFQGAAAGNELTRQTLVGRTSGQPAICFSTPVRESRAGQVGVAMACANLTALTEQVGAIRVDQTGIAFVVNEQGQILAHPELTEASELVNLSDYPPVQALQAGQSGPVPFVDQAGVSWLSNVTGLENGWGVVVQQQANEYLAEVNRFWGLMALATLGMVAAVGGLTWLVAGAVVAPLSQLTQAANVLAAGDLAQRVQINSRDELGILAGAFNTMAGQLQETISRLGARSRRLEDVAQVNERLSAVLNLEDLLAEVVNQVQTAFDYYHVQIYLLDEDRQNLVLAEATGEAGRHLKERGHRIAMNTEHSLVARAARSREAVVVADVHQSPDWLPNDLLPRTASEMALPIALHTEVAGVLDVQQDDRSALDEAAANLLRILTNQIAIALRNARLFAQVEASLAEAQRLQARYVAQSWDRQRMADQGKDYYYLADETAAPSETKSHLLAQAKQAALEQAGPALISLNGSADDTDNDRAAEAEGEQVVVAPVSLQNQKIGALYLHPAQSGQHWDARDLAMLQTILDRLAQTAENLRLFDETRQRAEYERLVGEITQRIRQAPDLESLTKTAAESVSQVLGSSHGGVSFNLMLPDAETEKGNGHVK